MNRKEDLHLLQYWRNTLADASRVEIQLDKTIFKANAEIDYQKGKIPVEQALALIAAAEKQLNEAKGFLNEKEEGWEYLQEIQIMIAPFCVSPLPEYIKLSGETGTFYPFWVRAILKKDGSLKTDEDTFPYIPRVYLEPQVNQDINFIFSDVDKIDLAFAKSFIGNGTWTEYWSYIREVFKGITELSPEQYASENFVVTHQNTIVVNETLANAADGIIQLYDYLIQSKEVPSLLEKLCRKHYQPLSPLLSTTDFESASSKHVGQMGHEYALSVSQRKSIYHFNTQATGDILAINGPPGTGKTTLLQSIVADKVVKSAIEGDGPAVILACSTNNQAVTNIIDGFSNVKGKRGLLYERWLPELTGFGLYLPKKSQVVPEHIVDIKRIQGKLTGAHTAKESMVYINRAEKQFVDRFERYADIKGLTFKEMINWLQNSLKTKKQSLEDGVRIWQHYKGIAALIEQLKPGLSFLLFHRNVVAQQDLDHIEKDIRNIESKISDYLDKESIWIKILSFLPFVKEKRIVRLKQLFRDCPVKYEAVNFYKISSIHQFFDEKLQTLKQIRELNTAWLNWKSIHNITGNPPDTDTDFKLAERSGKGYFYDELEMGMKYDMFYLAVHYWEARWLISTRDALSADRISKNGVAHAKERWQRFAMLTPCFVSTFYMAPKFFTYSKFIKTGALKSTFEAPPLIGFIDLLIVDEAGMVSPEIGAATFALAKQSVVVGDTKQIEPIWNVPKKVDQANLRRYLVIDNVSNETAIGDLLQKGFLSSSGSIMKLAQKASEYHLFPETERGMLLTEHRRCFNEIIEYCNRLAYNGLLEPKKGTSKNALLPPMQFIDVPGNSKKIGTSRANVEEATAISNWISANQNQLVEHYQNTENVAARKEGRPSKKIQFSDIVGIITPFTGQKFTLKNMLRKSGIDTSRLTIGTVHALQGAERLVILFSSTYGSNDLAKSYFFDSGVNMLNVAVSRAKESFIIFGSRPNFDKKGNTPSIKLYRHIESLTSN